MVLATQTTLVEQKFPDRLPHPVDYKIDSDSLHPAIVAATKLGDIVLTEAISSPTEQIEAPQINGSMPDEKRAYSTGIEHGFSSTFRDRGGIMSKISIPTTPGLYVNRKINDMKESIVSGALPHLGNGWKFTLDNRPRGEENEKIPADQYTAYFAERKIPVAAPGHAEFTHDANHVATYQRVFESKNFATYVEQSAKRSHGIVKQEQKFSQAMDGIGDAINNIFDNNPIRPADLWAIRNSLTEMTLVNEFDPGNPESIEQCRGSFEALWAELGFADLASCMTELAKNEGMDYEFGFAEDRIARWTERQQDEVTSTNVFAHQ